MRPWELHPALVHFPIAFLAGAAALDVFAWWRKRHGLLRVVAGLFVAGSAMGWLAALAGLLAYFTVPAHADEAHGLMNWHLGIMLVTVAAFTGYAAVRWRTRPGVPTPEMRVVGALLVGSLFLGSYLGGEIVYKGGAGIDPAILAPELRHGHGEHGPPRQ
jgi:uncharacterized membrane protein